MNALGDTDRRLIEQIVATRMWGDTVDEVCVRLIQRGLTEMVLSGEIQKRIELTKWLKSDPLPRVLK